MNSNPVYEVSLDNYQDEFVKRFSFFLENERYVDVNIKCGNKCIKVHKIVLVASSEYFQVAWVFSFIFSHYRQFMKIVHSFVSS